MDKLSEIKGITDSEIGRLEGIGINSLGEFLERGETKSEREGIAKETKIKEGVVLSWLNRIDLSRVNGIGPQYASLLEHAGVDTVPELGHRNPEHLYVSLEELNSEQRLVKKMPTFTQVRRWVHLAKRLPRRLEY